MMKTPKTRREHEIWRACDELMASGIPGNKVTGDTIREHLLELGFSKGSPNEIYKYRKSWREARGIEDEDFRQSVTGTVALTDPLTRAVEVVRTEIRAESQVEIDNVKKDTQTQINTMQKTLQEAESQLQNSLEKNQLFDTENSELKSAIILFQVQLSEERQKTAALEQALKSSDASYKKLEQTMQNLLLELKNSHDRTQKTLEKQLQDTEVYYQKEINEYKELLEKHRHKSIVEIEHLKTMNHKVEIKYLDIENQLKQSCQKEKKYYLTIEILETKINSLQEKIKNKQNKIQEVEITSSISETELKHFRNQCEIQLGIQKELQHNLQISSQLIGRLEERNQQLEASIVEKKKNDSRLDHVES